MPDSRAMAYKEKLDALMTDAADLSPAARRAVLDQLRQASAAISRVLAKADPESYSASRSQELKAEIQRVMASFARSASVDVGKVQKVAYDAGALGVDSVVAAAYGGSAVHTIIDARTIAVVQGYTADLITGLSQDTAAKINGALQRAYVGRSTLNQLTAQIGGALEGGKFTGLFSPAGERAMSIATNETMRLHSVAAMTRMTALAPTTPGLQKQWLHIPAARVPRVSHILANNQVRDVTASFEVGGEELDYPRDPSGRADNTINCHCLVRPYVPPALLQPSDRERELLDKLGLSVTTEAA